MQPFPPLVVLKVLGLSFPEFNTVKLPLLLSTPYIRTAFVGRVPGTFLTRRRQVLRGTSPFTASARTSLVPRRSRA